MTPETSKILVPEISIEGSKVIAGVPMEQRDRPIQPFLYLLSDTDDRLSCVITGIDLSDFESVVGAKIAKEYRALVCARRGWYNPEETDLSSPSISQLNKFLDISRGFLGKIFMSNERS